MNPDLFQDTQFSAVVRMVSGKKLFRFPDEIDPSLWKKSVQKKQQDSTNTPNSSSEEDVEPRLPPTTLQGSDDSVVRDKEIDNLPAQLLSDINHTVEDGKDIFLIDWYGPDDPEVSMPRSRGRKAKPFSDAKFSKIAQNPHNWSRNRKLLISFQICFLNFAFYMASSIYVPGEGSIMEDFGVGETVATLGLSLFTL